MGITKEQEEKGKRERERDRKAFVNILRLTVQVVIHEMR